MGSRATEGRCYSAGVEDGERGHEPRNAGAKVKTRFSSWSLRFRPVRLIPHLGPPEWPRIRSRWLQATEFVAMGYRSSKGTGAPVKTVTLRMLLPASEIRSSSRGWWCRLSAPLFSEGEPWLAKTLLLPTWHDRDRPGGRLEPAQI